MAGDDPKKFPNPEFLRTKTLGSRDLADIDYDDEMPTGVDHRSERPSISGPPPKVDPNDVYYLTDRPAHREPLPSFSETVAGPFEEPRRDLPPVVPSPGPREPRPAPLVSPLAHSPAPPGTHPSTARLPPVQGPTEESFYGQPLPLVARPRPSQRPARRRRHVWKPVVPPPRFPPSPALARPVPPSTQAHKPGPKPVEDRLLNALGVFFLGVVLTTLAGLAFLVVTNTRVAALRAFITDPSHPLPSFSAPPPSHSD